MSILSHECMEDIENSLISHGYHHTIAAAIADAVLNHDRLEAEARGLKAENARLQHDIASYIEASTDALTKLESARRDALEEAARHHDKEIAATEQQIQENKEYLRREGLGDNHEVNDYCEHAIRVHRLAAAAIRSLKGKAAP